MMLNTKLLNFFGVLATGSFMLDVASASDDLDETLKQALFLVQLLKTDFTEVLRANDDLTANFTEEENSTCSLPEDSNSTINETKVTVSMSPSMPLSTPYTQQTPPPSMPPGAPLMLPNTPPGAPMMLPNTAPGGPVMLPNTPLGATMMLLNTPGGGPMMMPYTSWPAMPMGYHPPPPSGPGQQNFQDENYRFPYRINRRRMMPDYYYFDSPVNSRGNFRRFGNDPSDFGNTPATSQAQTTTSVSSATSEVTTLNVGEKTASTTSLAPMKSELSSSILPTNSANQSILQSNFATQSILQGNSAKQSILQSNSANQTILQANLTNQSILQSKSVNQSNLPTNYANQSNLPTNSSNQSNLPTNSTNQSSLSTNFASQFDLPTISTNQSDLSIISTNHSILSKNSANQFVIAKNDSAIANQSNPPTSRAVKQTINRNRIITATRNSILSTPKSILRTTKRPHLPTMEFSTLTPKPRKRVRHGKRVPVSKATTKLIRYRNKNHPKVRDLHLRQQKSTTETNSNDFVEMSQVATELENELEDNDNRKDTSNEEARSTKTTTMKVFLPGSSRMPVPFSENNGFCYFYPKNALCGTNL